MEVLQTAYPEDVAQTVVAELKNVLGTILVLQDQISPGSLDALLQLDSESGSVRDILIQLHSVLEIPESDSSVIRIIHSSFPDCMFDPQRCDARFHVDKQNCHTQLARLCLDAMGCLKRNMCELDDPSLFLLNRDIPNLGARISRHIPLHVQYACKYWAHHLSLARPDEGLLKPLDTFLHGKLLYWVEVSSVIGRADIVIRSLEAARMALRVRTTSFVFMLLFLMRL